MLKKLMLGTALSALMLSGALAQAPSSPAPSASSPPPAAQPMSPPADSSKSSKSSPSSTTASAPAGDKAAVISSQQPDQWLASKFKGTDVVGSDDKKIGDVSDILFDKSGKIEAYVVSVGGFLGMGAKSVAMAPSSFEVVPGTNGGSPKLKTSMNKDELKQAQNFKPYEPPHATTGMGGSSNGLGGRPSPSPMSPHK